MSNGIVLCRTKRNRSFEEARGGKWDEEKCGNSAAIRADQWERDKVYELWRLRRDGVVRYKRRRWEREIYTHDNYNLFVLVIREQSCRLEASYIARSN